jgi:hypothetical protein
MSGPLLLAVVVRLVANCKRVVVDLVVVRDLEGVLADGSG